MKKFTITEEFTFDEIEETTNAELYGDDLHDKEFGTETWTSSGITPSGAKVDITYRFEREEIKDIEDHSDYPWDEEHVIDISLSQDL